MISVTIRLNNGKWRGFTVRGHANWAEAGQDIVCAGVSSLTQTTVLALTRLLEIEPAVQVKEGHLKVTLPPLSTEVYPSCHLLCEAMLLGINEIARLYPENLTISILKESEDNGA